MSNLTSEKTIIVGYSEDAKNLLEELKSQFNKASNMIIGIIDNNHSKGSEVLGIPFLGKIIEIEEIVKEKKADGIVQIGHFEQSFNMITFCRANNLSYRAIPLALSSYAKNFKSENYGGLITLKLESTPLSGIGLFVKNLLDLLLSFILAVFTLPLFIFIVLLLKIEDITAPVLVSEDRYSGRLGKKFSMYRFRTLPKGESENINKYTFRELPEKLRQIREDKRATKVGRFLRKTYLSELPQIYNVLFGKMSLVGPRPPYAVEVENYSDSLRKRLLVKPGITGLWQVHRHEKFSFEEMFNQDSFYVENWSLVLDLSILGKTISKLFKHRRSVK